MTTQLEVEDGGKGEKKMDEKPWVTNTGSGKERARQTEMGDGRVVWRLQPHFFLLLPVTRRSSHVEFSLFQAWAPLSEFTD